MALPVVLLWICRGEPAIDCEITPVRSLDTFRREFGAAPAAEVVRVWPRTHPARRLVEQRLAATTLAVCGQPSRLKNDAAAHAAVSALDGAGNTSGRSSCAGMPVMASTFAACVAGTCVHWDSADGKIPSADANSRRRPRCSSSHVMSFSIMPIISVTEFQSR